MSEILSIIIIILTVFIICVLFFYAFAGLFSLPFFFLWLLFRILFFPITLINTIFYPVWVLPYIVVAWFLAYFFIKFVLSSIKGLLSLKSK